MTIHLPRNPWVRAAIAVGPIALAVALLWWRGPSVGLVADAFTVVSWPWVAAALGINLLSILARSLAWHTVIGQAMPAPRPRHRSVFAAFSVGLLANAVLPGRIGELARVAVLARRLPRGRGVWATLMGTVFAHRVFDFVAMGALIVYVLLAARTPAWAITTLAALLGLGVALLAFGIAGARPHHRALAEGVSAVRRLLAMARNGLGVLRTPVSAIAAGVFQCLGWALQLVAVYAAMRAFQIEEPLAAAGLVLVLMNVAMIFPLWPGNFGLVQAAVALPLLSYGIDYPHGFAFGIGLQAIEAFTGIALGLVFLAREGLSFAALRRIPREDGEARPFRRKHAARARARVPS